MNGGGGDGDYRYDDLDALLRLGLPQTMQQSPNHRTRNNGTSQNAQPPNYGGPSSRHGYDPAGGAASSSSLPASSAYPSTATYLPPPPQFVGGISTTVGMHSTSIPTHLMNLHRPLTTNPNKTVPTPSSFSNLPGSHSQILSQTGITTSFSSLPMNAYSSHTFFKQDESYLDRMSIPVSAISLEPLSGVDVVRRVETKAQHVMTRYLPCVTFLVQCQQDLRDGLESGSMTNRTGYSRGRRATLTPRQYYAKCLHSLPDKFHRSNSRIMEAKELSIAVQEIHALCQNAKRVEYQGCEVMKNTFLGGIKDGESWGLRKWLSKHGGALHICNDIESILNACQKLNRDEESTKKLSAKLRPVAQYALDRLKKGVPDSYQKVSSAHPYLPFFHRLESALKNMATFDPDDDDVICIDDEDELEEAKASAKRKQQANAVSDNTCRPAEKKSRVERDVVAPFADSRPNAGDGGDNDIEVWDEKPAARPSRPLPQQLPPTHPAQSEEWRCPCCHMLNPATADTHCILCNGSYSQGPVGALPADPGGGGPLEDDDDSFRRAMEDFANLEDVDWPDISRQTSEHSSRVDASLSQQQQQPSVEKMSANDMADRLDHLAATQDASWHA